MPLKLVNLSKKKSYTETEFLTACEAMYRKGYHQGYSQALSDTEQSKKNLYPLLSFAYHELNEWRHRKHGGVLEVPPSPYKARVK